MAITYGSVCSGIEAATVAWRHLGWEAAWYSEIESFPSAVLAHHYPETPNLGDMTLLPEMILSGAIPAPDILCGGTPCQAFSVAGNRESLSDDRGNLSLVFCRIADAIDNIRQSRGELPGLIFWENVPGVLSTSDNAFGQFISQLSGESTELKPTGRSWPNAGIICGPQRTVIWRMLDSQYFGLAQRRKRVYVVSSARTDIDIGEILFELSSVQVNYPPIRQTRKTNTKNPQGVSAEESRSGELTDVFCISGASIGRINKGGNGTDINNDTCFTLTATDVHAVAFKVRGKGHHTGEKGGRIVDTSLSGGHGMIVTDEKTFTIAATQDQYIATGNTLWHSLGYDPMRINYQDLSPTITASGTIPHVNLRRLTPRECERLQGFPDDYTQIPYRGKPAADCPDGVRYKALGNSWPVNVIIWIGERINALIS